jgi:predicted Zn-dependent protease
VVKAFEGSVTDVTSTLMNSGYARSLENEADAAAVQILTRAGYRPQALVEMLAEMKTRLASDTRGFGKTHPAPESRIQHVNGLLTARTFPAAPPARQQRFNAAIALAR